MDSNVPRSPDRCAMHSSSESNEQPVSHHEQSHNRAGGLGVTCGHQPSSMSRFHSRCPSVCATRAPEGRRVGYVLCYVIRANLTTACMPVPLAFNLNRASGTIIMPGVAAHAHGIGMLQCRDSQTATTVCTVHTTEGQCTSTAARGKRKVALAPKVR